MKEWQAEVGQIWTLGSVEGMDRENTLREWAEWFSKSARQLAELSAAYGHEPAFAGNCMLELETKAVKPIEHQRETHKTLDEIRKVTCISLRLVLSGDTHTDDAVEICLHVPEEEPVSSVLPLGTPDRILTDWLATVETQIASGLAERGINPRQPHIDRDIQLMLIQALIDAKAFKWESSEDAKHEIGKQEMLEHISISFDYMCDIVLCTIIIPKLHRAGNTQPFLVRTSFRRSASEQNTNSPEENRAA